MKRRSPRQKPGLSEQSVGTPPEFIRAACSKLWIPRFNWDLAADAQNTKCQGRFFSESDNAFVQDWSRIDPDPITFQCALWNWLNPPFSDITPWAEKCVEEASRGAHIALLVPSSTGANWWNDYVHGYGYVLALRSRIQFLGHTHGYPKDLALILYTPTGFNGYDLWDWRAELEKAA